MHLGKIVVIVLCPTLLRSRYDVEAVDGEKHERGRKFVAE